MARVQASLLVLAIVAVATTLTTVSGATYNVGEPGGSWNTQTNLTAWASSINFRTGDTLVFKYSAAAHDVVEVNSSNYSSCSAKNPIATFRTGNDSIQLASAMTRYFICGVPGHCATGMKLQVKVTAAPTPCRNRRRQRQRGFANGNDCSSSAASVSSGIVSSVLVIMAMLMLKLVPWCN